MSEVSEFDPQLESLKHDIDHIDFRLGTINKNIIILQTNIDGISQTLLTGNLSQTDKNKLYMIQNDLLRTLASYNDNYERLLGLKFKYRSEQDDFTLKVKRYVEIELKKINTSIEDTDVNYKDVMNALSNFTLIQEDKSKVFEFSDDEKI